MRNACPDTDTQACRCHDRMITSGISQAPPDATCCAMDHHRCVCPNSPLITFGFKDLPDEGKRQTAERKTCFSHNIQFCISFEDTFGGSGFLQGLNTGFSLLVN